MKILFAASEGTPYCKTGGLADVIGALPQELAKQNHSLMVALPLYRTIDKSKFKIKPARQKVTVPLNFQDYSVGLAVHKVRKNFSILFIDSPFHFNRDGIYGPPGGDFPDNDERYIVFCRAILEGCKKLRWKPDIIHGHDWQTGLISGYLKTLYQKDPFYQTTKSVFTIHNLAYQGVFPSSTYPKTQLPGDHFRPDRMEYYGQTSFLKAGIIYADRVTTVSPTYAKEIRETQQFGMGMEWTLSQVGVKGILNGLDVKIWNPQTDSNLMMNFSAVSLSKRQKCKQDLQKRTGLSVNGKTPLLGFVGRLDHQKGMDMILETAPQLLKDGCQMVILGQGDLMIHSRLRDFMNNNRKQVYVENNFANDLAHKIYGGSDIFMMPSRFEPCGLGQMIAMRYGSLPVVTPTGGLNDTVFDLQANPKKGNGFVALDLSPNSYGEALKNAVVLYRKKPTLWASVQMRAMKIDFSWNSSLRVYEKLYADLKSKK